MLNDFVQVCLCWLKTGCLGIRTGPLSFGAGDDNAETTVDMLLIYSATRINHHMLPGRSEVNEFIHLEFSARSKAVRSTSGRGRLPSLLWFSSSTILFHGFFYSFYNNSLVQTDKSFHLLWKNAFHVWILLDTNTMSNSVALIWCGVSWPKWLLLCADTEDV